MKKTTIRTAAVITLVSLLLPIAACGGCGKQETPEEASAPVIESIPAETAASSEETASAEAPASAETTTSTKAPPFRRNVCCRHTTAGRRTFRRCHSYRGHGGAGPVRAHPERSARI